MSLQALVENYDSLPIRDQALFEEVVQHLFSEGSLWREGDQERSLYEFVMKHQNMMDAFLLLVGWELHHHDRHKIFHIIHRDKRNRYDFSADQIRLLLLLRLLYARGQEQAPSIVRPSSMSGIILVPINAVTQQFFATYGKHVSRTGLRDAVRVFTRFKLVRLKFRDGGRDITNAEVELLPMLEVIIPNERLHKHLDDWIGNTSSGEDEDRDA